MTPTPPPLSPQSSESAKTRPQSVWGALGVTPTFQLILLDSRRKFLSSQKCLGIEVVCQHLQRLLANEVIATVSIRRLQPKGATDRSPNTKDNSALATAPQDSQSSL